jgi:ADP-ribose pyrophosphatase YjhB (NUDIX family)
MDSSFFLINIGEHPESAIKRIVKEQLGSESKARLLEVQSYGDKHWDIVFVYEVSIDGIGHLHPDIETAAYFDVEKLPSEFRADHMEVLQSFENRRK